MMPVVAGAAALAGDGSAQTGSWPITVVELFTSQGCSSCLPSDAYLSELAKRPDIVALSFHVDYWDYIGWKDPYASPQFTERQRGYARSLKQRYVYTPEMVIDGRAHETGLDRGAIRYLIAEAQKPELPRVVVRITDRGDGKIGIRVSRLEIEEPYDLWLVTYDPEQRTKVLRGENRGRDLVNNNVARTLTLLLKWDGQPVEITVDADKLGSAKGVAVLVQRPELGPIVGAAAIVRAI